MHIQAHVLINTNQYFVSRQQTYDAQHSYYISRAISKFITLGAYTNKIR